MRDLRKVLKSSREVQVHAHWDPIADSTFNMSNESPEHVQLFDLSPVYPIKEYRMDAFQAFLPPSESTVVGDVWELDSMGIVAFLRQFHADATLSLYHGETGAYGCLQRYSSDYAEIVFRVHAEIVLKTDVHESWRRAEGFAENEGEARFTVSQFAGRLIMNLKEGNVVFFSCGLPARNSNVSISAYDYIDMVFVPRMELIIQASEDLEQIVWTDEITEAATHRALELKFYKFAEIHWLPIPEAVRRAQAIHRPIHAILVWGQLDDQSC